MKKRKPKSLYEARILGAFILVFILGLLIKNSVPASYLLLIIGPIAVVWFMKYDDAKYLVYTKIIHENYNIKTGGNEMDNESNKLIMSKRFEEWFKNATENCAERELYATALIARMDWLVDPIISKSYRYDLTTELNQNHSSAWYDVATEICNKRKETVIRAILEDNIEIEGD